MGTDSVPSPALKNERADVVSVNEMHASLGVNGMKALDILKIPEGPTYPPPHQESEGNPRSKKNFGAPLMIDGFAFTMQARQTRRAMTIVRPGDLVIWGPMSMRSMDIEVPATEERPSLSLVLRWNGQTPVACFAGKQVIPPEDSLTQETMAEALRKLAGWVQANEQSAAGATISKIADGERNDVDEMM